MSPSPKPGDIVLVRRGTGILDKLVQFFTTSPYFHAAMVLEGGDLIEAAFGGVRRVDGDKYAGRSDTLSPANATDAQRAAATQWAREKLLLGYGWHDILADALRLGLHVPVGYRWRTWRHLDCSCLCAAAWATAGLPLTFVPAPSPGDLGFSPVLVGPRPWPTENAGVL